MIWDRISPDQLEATLHVGSETIRVIVFRDDVPVMIDGRETKRAAYCYSVTFWTSGRGVTGQIWNNTCETMSEARDRAVAALRHACPDALVWCQSALL